MILRILKITTWTILLWGKSLIRNIKFSFSKKDKVFNPVFLIGCGRSGTTILGTTLGQHVEITYLNERRDIWHTAFPELDIWSGIPIKPRFQVGSEDISPKKKQKLRSLFFKEQTIDKGNILLEKLPINTFRLEFIEAIFPEAKYIYLYRNGLEVAQSIAVYSEKGEWFAAGEERWNTFSKLAELKNISIRGNSYLEKGLSEWRLSTEYAEDFFQKIAADRFFKLSYQDFLNDPQVQVKQLYSFLGISFEDSFVQKITKGISRRSSLQIAITPALRDIGGETLIKSIENSL